MGEGVLGGLGHVEVLEGVELPHAREGGASALKSEHESVLRERGHRVAGFPWGVSVYLSQATLHICFAADTRFA